jgi:hypothetical protein
MKVFLAVAAVLAWLFGVTLLAAPGPFYSPSGVTLTPMLATLAQAHGATLIGLGTVNWFGRNADGTGLRAILLGNFVTQVLSFAVAARTASLGAGAKVAPALVIHSVLGALFLFFLLRARGAAARRA